ncbi:SGNH/GDSL hydrolase family protein [Paenibacillus sp. JSM ZJ436]|uniref:SGNH/GDSL hydrolase family protein n=1 Tax=Paenibacillus sp. JSM ZJ436 TaxID=3376190 RepID=UPI00379030BD
MLIVCIGDSITEGLGVIRTKSSYADLIKKQFQEVYSIPVNVLNFGASAMQINESLEKYSEKIISLQPDIVIIAHGITESIVREQKKYLRYLPKRWRRPGWMDPRAYYSRSKLRRFMEKTESSIRWRTKVALIKIFGGLPWMNISDFENYSNDFVSKILTNSPSTNIIFLSPSDVDQKYFPGSSDSMSKYREVTKKICELNSSTCRVFMCDSHHVLDKWTDYFEDHFHPNEHGHKKIANMLVHTIKENDLFQKKLIRNEVSI